MRILFVAPYPPSRIRVRSYGFLQQLQRDHEVVVLALCSSQGEMADVEALRRQGYEEVVAVPGSRWPGMLRSGLAVASSQSLQVAYARSASFLQAFQRLCMQRHFDIVHVEHLRGIALIEPLAHDLPLVWDAVDCLSLLYNYTIEAGPNLAMRSLAVIEQKRLQRYEASMINTLPHILVTSQRDRQALIELARVQAGDGACCHAERVSRSEPKPLSESEGPERSEGEASPAMERNPSLPLRMTAAIEVLPNGVDLDYFRPLQQKRRRFNIVFSGTMSYHPNVATALYLYRHIMPLIWRQRPEATLTLVGSGPPKAIQRLASDARVEVTGYVDDMRPYIAQAELMLCPMVYSVGIQNKVLEAMALGTPVVVAPQTAKVFEVCQGRDLLVAETPQKFADAALRLLDDTELRSTLSHYGRAYVEQHHDWQAVTERLVDIYSQARGAIHLVPTAQSTFI